ncbi:ABC transporter permease [Hydrogenophaga sp. 5NK40-0174]|uniref:ABC transporter permease n=1 Tax=Hydrogenophaga sp. 5NK40-0174 TaxID=3127649 RepID=UPI003106FD57
MISVARASLVHEWRRYLAAVLAVTFAGLLLTVQLALLLGMFGTVSVIIDQSSADLWLGFRNTQSVDLGRPVNPASASRAWMHPGVSRVEPYLYAYGDLRRDDGVPVSVLINAIDTSHRSLALSELLTPEQRSLLREPDAMLIDAADLGKLDASIGTVVEINGKRARIAGIVEGLRAIGGANVVTSFATARSISPSEGNHVTFYLISVRPGYDAAAVARDIADQRQTPQYSVWLADELSVQSQAYWLLESGSGIGTGFASLLALIVGIVITSQTLSGAIMASIKEYAAMRALGVPLRSLRAIVIEQALWVGVMGLAITAALTGLTAWLGHTWRISMSFPWWMLVSVAILLLLISAISGLISLRPLLRAQPASLLR